MHSLIGTLLVTIVIFATPAKGREGDPAGGKLNDPCHMTRPCGKGFSCQPGVHKCYDKPRKEGQPCVAGHACGSDLTCEAGSHVCRAKGKEGDPCHVTRPCDKKNGFTCEAGTHVCRAAGKEGDPCHVTRPCDKKNGFTCEAGTQVCRAGGKLNDPCHMTRPCGKGFSCQPGVHKCYDKPRKEGQPCVLGHACGPDLTCEAGSHVCRAKGREGDPCHVTRPCDKKNGFTCEAGTHVCRAAGKEGDPCHMTRPCDKKNGFSCEAFTHKCRKGGEEGDFCHMTRPCSEGFSCQPVLQKCYAKPRKEGQPCIPGVFGCGDGLSCFPVTCWSKRVIKRMITGTLVAAGTATTLFLGHLILPYVNTFILKKALKEKKKEAKVAQQERSSMWGDLQSKIQGVLGRQGKEKATFLAV